MGGKNAIIVDDDADLDEAVLGVVKSAFGYQGQKCSACSRGIVLAIGLRHVSDAAGRSDAQLEGRPGRRSGHQRRPGDRCRSARANSKSTSKWAEAKRARCWRSMSGRWPNEATSSGRTSLPTCRRQPARQEEIFGPVLAVIRASDLDEAIRDRQRHRLRADRRHFFAQPGESGSRVPRDSWSAICISTAPITGAWSAGSRSAASNCRASAARPAARIICCSSCFRARSPRTPCAAASRRRIAEQCGE